MSNINYVGGLQLSIPKTVVKYGFAQDTQNVLVNYEVIGKLSKMIELFDKIYEKLRLNVPKDKFKLIEMNGVWHAYFSEELDFGSETKKYNLIYFEIGTSPNYISAIVDGVSYEDESNNVLTSNSV